MGTRPSQEVDCRSVRVTGQGQLSGAAVNWKSRLAAAVHLGSADVGDNRNLTFSGGGAYSGSVTNQQLVHNFEGEWRAILLRDGYGRFHRARPAEHDPLQSSSKRKRGPSSPRPRAEHLFNFHCPAVRLLHRLPGDALQRQYAKLLYRITHLCLRERPACATPLLLERFGGRD